MDVSDPRFWRAGAIATTVVMVIMLVLLTIDTYGAIESGGRNVPPYSVINQQIGYAYDVEREFYVPVIGDEELLFGHKYSETEARAAARKGKLVIQSRSCMLCHTFFGNGSYYAPDLTKAWLDPAWEEIWMPMTDSQTRGEAMVKFLMSPDEYPAWTRRMPDLDLDEEEATAIVVYLKWMSSIDTNGFPSRFGATGTEQ